MSSSADERSGYLPPHELRALFAQLGDRGEAGGVPHNPGPSIAQSTPGIGGASLAPTGIPAFAADDPNTIGIMLARMANEMGVSAVPVPTPESLTTGRGMSAPASPGAVPQLIANVPGAPSLPLDAISPQVVAMSDSSPGVAGAPSGSPVVESIVPFGGGATSTGTPAALRPPDFGMLLASSNRDQFSVPLVSAPFGSETGDRHSSATGNRQQESGTRQSLQPRSTTLPAHSLPAHSQHSQPAHSQSTQPAHSLPAHSQHSQLTHSQPAHSQSTQPAHSQSAHSQSVYSQPVHSQPVHSQSAHSQPAHSQSAGSQAKHSQPVHSQPLARAPSFEAPSIDQAPAIPTSSMSTAAPGRPGGFGMPASNAASPGGFPGAPMSVMPGAPTLPFASNAEHMGNSGPGRFGAAPPIGGAAISSPGTLPTTTVPNATELQGFAGDSMTTTSAPVSDGSNPSPNAGTRDTAALSSPGAGRSPFEPTNLDHWSPFADSNHGGVGRLPLVGDGLIAGEPPSTPDFQLPFVDGDSIDAAPGFTPQGSQLQGGPTVTGGESLAHGDRSIRQVSGAPFDPYVVRKDFPILDQRVQGGKRLVWLDNAATTQKPRAVIDRLTRYYEHENSNVHRAAHTLAARATDAFESGRESTRKFLNAPSTSEIIFVRGATEGINLLANTWGVKNVRAGDEIVVTHLEHHANIVPWQMLCGRVGAKLRVAPVDDRGDVIMTEYEKLIGPRTKLVAFTQVSNALGTITPAREMIEIAHRRGATVMLDGAQAVSHMPVDVQQLGCDFYVFSGHKVFAPTGIGAIYGRKELLEDMPPWQGGGNMIADVTFEKTVYQGPPWRFEAGTGNIADAAGLGAALDYIMRIGMNVIDRYEHDLLVYATEKLIRIPGLRMIGNAVNKAGVLSFVLDGQRTEDVGAALDKEGIAVRSGHHCAQPILRRFGLEASVRASLAFYNVCEDIDALVDSVTRLQAHRRSVVSPGIR